MSYPRAGANIEPLYRYLNSGEPLAIGVTPTVLVDKPNADNGTRILQAIYMINTAGVTRNITFRIVADGATNDSTKNFHSVSLNAGAVLDPRTLPGIVVKGQQRLYALGDGTGVQAWATYMEEM